MKVGRGSIGVLLACASASVPARAQEAPFGKVANWRILAISDKGQFHRCTASLTDRGGMLRIHQLRTGAWTLSWPRGDLPKTSKADGSVDFGRASFVMRADVDNGTRASTGLDAGMVSALRGAKAISVTVGRNRFSWTVDDVQAAMDAVGKCRGSNGQAAGSGASTAAGMIYPDYPGASQTCVLPRGSKWADGTPLVLDKCPSAGSKAFVRAAAGLASASVKDLCVGIARGAHRGVVELQKCGEAATKWSTKATAAKAARVTSSDGECWAISAIANDKARFPLEVEAVECGDKRSKPLDFYFE